MKRILLLLFLTLSGVYGYSQSAELDQNLARTISVYPNPAVDFVDVNLGEFLRADKVKLTLHNIIGNEVSAETEQLDEHKIRVKLKDLASGYYLLAIRDEETKFKGTFKFVKR